MPNQGLAYAMLAFTLWGVFPIFWKMLGDVDSVEILAHRILWGSVFMVLLTALRHQWRGIVEILRNRRNMLLILTTSLLVACNWWLNIYAVLADKILEASMGYYINPLLSVLLGVLFYKERLRPLQWIAIVLAGLGVGYMVILHGYVPYVALMLSGSFAVYGVIKKMATFPSMNGMAVETWLLVLPSLAFVLFLEDSGQGQFTGSPYLTTLLVLSGPITLAPLLLFAAAAQRISLTLLGLCQYIAPTMQLVIGVLIYGESLDDGKLPAFMLIWGALILFTLENIWSSRKRSRLSPQPPGPDTASL
ncbi:MAG: EamA family transporter RarD [Porticoccaceae bacterium]